MNRIGELLALVLAPPCPVCKKPITDRASPNAVICAACIRDALAQVLARREREKAEGHQHHRDGRRRQGAGTVMPHAVRWDEVADACAQVAMVGYEIVLGYYFSADDADAGDDYCRPCAELKAAEIKARRPGDEDAGRIDGGWRTEHDHLIFCVTCGQPLDGSFTDYAVEQELEHFETYAFDITEGSDCHALQTMLISYSWRGDKHSARLRRLAFKAIRQSLERSGSTPSTAGGGKEGGHG